MDLKPKLLDLLQRARKEEQAFVSNLLDDERAAEGTLEQWSAKDMMAHIAAWKERMAQNLAAVARGEAPRRTEDIDEANAEIFEEHQHRSWAEILEYAKQAYRMLVETVQAMDEEKLTTGEVLPWQDGRPLWRFIAGNGYTHPILHMAQFYSDRGEADHATEIMEEAAGLLAQFDESSDWQGIVRYNLACHYALAGQKEKAISELRQALRLNPELTAWSKQDPDFASVRQEAEYQALY